MHVQRHIRVVLDEFLNDWRQRITCLGVGGCQCQRALALVAELLGNLLDAVDLAQNLAGSGNDALSGRCDAGQVLATAGKDLDTQLILQQPDLLARYTDSGQSPIRSAHDGLLPRCNAVAAIS